ncbi:MAG: oxygenase MpaB family protein [Myxococcota bacterium]
MESRGFESQGDRRGLECAGGGEVDRDALETRLADLEQSLPDRRAGLFGPTSKLWEVNRHSVIFLGGGRAALLQLAHPHVAQAIADHSRSLEDPLGRFQRTFAHVFDMVYGPAERAFAAARRVHRVHEHIRGELAEGVGPRPAGEAYRANEPSALLWVHATLWETSVGIFESIVRPLGEDEKDRYLAETGRFAALFGIPRARLAPSWDAFRAYNEDLWASDELTVSDAARAIADALLRPPTPALAPLMSWYRGFVGASLPPRIRRGFGLPGDSPQAQRRHRRDLRWLRRIEPRLPGRLRYLPPYVAGRRRVAGLPEFDWLGRQLAWVFVGRPPA